MPDSPMTETHKRALIVAYYLSRFDRKGVRRTRLCFVYGRF